MLWLIKNGKICNSDSNLALCLYNKFIEVLRNRYPTHKIFFKNLYEFGRVFLLQFD